MSKQPDKKSFLLYCDQSELIQKLSDEQAGNLIKQIYSYCGNGRERPEIIDPLIDIVFTALQTSLDRDHLKYIERCHKNKIAAQKRWMQTHANASDGNQMDATNADNGNGNGSETTITPGL